ncbi:MAG: hypothetical protein JXR76_17705 [Deltaproteobacteria bacterium]|nr:hypothetical protein [Deltaproteobacteria bacterium]
MKWDPDARALYKNVIKNIPLPQKLIATPSISWAAEKTAASRSAMRVSLADVLSGIFEVVPQSFQARTVANLTALGVDCKPYLHGSQRLSVIQTDLKQLWKTLITLGNQLGVAVDEVKTRAILEAYSNYFTRAPIAIGAASNDRMPKTLFVRYLDTVQHQTPDPVTKAVLKGFLPEDDTPLLSLFEEMKMNLEIVGYGTTLDVTTGVSILRVALPPVQMDALLQLQHLPAAVKRNRSVLNRFDMDRFSMLGFDLRECTVSLFALIRCPSSELSGKYSDLLNELHLSNISDSLLTHCALSRVVHFTFSWQNDAIEKVCFTTIHSAPNTVPVEFDAFLDKCIRMPEFSPCSPKYILTTAVERENHYFVLENDYSGDMQEVILRACRAGI